MKLKRILTMQDLSCAGQCSLTVALPILSAYGLETCVLPTAVLSNHTMFKSWSYLDLTGEMPAIFENWEKSGIDFDAFLLGYLGKKELMTVAEECFQRFSKEGAKVIIDPVMGDNGKLYKGFDEDYVAAMRGLIKRADVILPNVTEACYLTGTEYEENYDEAFVRALAEKLSLMTDGKIIITGCLLGKDIGEFIYGKDFSELLMHIKLDRNFHGTGDIFSSVFTANYLSGKTISASCNEAAKFVADCIKATPDEHYYGVTFEQILKNR